MSINLLDPRLGDLAAEPGVSDVLLSGCESCSVVVNGRLAPRANPFADAAELDRLAVKLIAAGGRQLDQANPFADVMLGEFRIHAVLRSSCSKLTQLSIRYLGQRPPALEQLQGLGMFDVQVGDVLREIVQRRQSFLISGPTGSGKTSLLRAMLGLASEERILTIEDIPELRLGGSAVELLTRRANSEGAGEVSMERLLVEALRMRPDRIVVGELRSSELLSLLQAMNSGHTGSGATIHANSIESVPARLQAIAMLSGVWAYSIDSLTANAFDWVIQLGIVDGSRRVVAIARMPGIVGAGMRPKSTGRRVAA
jgi:pilus assembly protein CpaF